MNIIKLISTTLFIFYFCLSGVGQFSEKKLYHLPSPGSLPLYSRRTWCVFVCCFLPFSPPLASQITLHQTPTLSPPLASQITLHQTPTLGARTHQTVHPTKCVAFAIVLLLTLLLVHSAAVAKVTAQQNQARNRRTAVVVKVDFKLGAQKQTPPPLQNPSATLPTTPLASQLLLQISINLVNIDVA